MTLAEKIRDLRQKRGWSCSDLARASHIPQPTVWRLEQGKTEDPKANTLIALAKAFKVPVDYLVQDEYQLPPGFKSERTKFTIPSFICEAHWEPDGLVIECPSLGARDFVARAIEDNPIVVKVKEKAKDEL